MGVGGGRVAGRTGGALMLRCWAGAGRAAGSLVGGPAEAKLSPIPRVSSGWRGGGAAIIGAIAISGLIVRGVVNVLDGGPKEGLALREDGISWF